jgi:uncharacterized protein
LASLKQSLAAFEAHCVILITSKKWFLADDTVWNLQHWNSRRNRMFGRLKNNLLLAIAIVPCSVVSAASFDCAKSRTRVEKLVCESQKLSRLDTEVGRAYDVVIDSAPPITRAGLIAEQKDWMSNERDKCADEGCLVNAYSAGIHALIFITTNKSTAEYVVDRQKLESQTSAFERDLNRSGIPGKLSSCKIILHLVDPTTQGRDTSFGAICTLDVRDVMICDETVVGKLTLKLYGFTESARELADFTNTNCPPGG